MDINLKIQKSPKGNMVYLIDNVSQLKNITLIKEEEELIELQLKNKVQAFVFYRTTEPFFVINLNEKETQDKTNEQIRIAGATYLNEIKKHKIKEIGIQQLCQNEKAAYLFAEGLLLAAYQFLKYKSDAKEISHSLQYINFDKDSLLPSELKKLETITRAIYITRDLINEPLSYLTATQLSEELKKIGKDGMVKVGVYSKAKIEQLGMGGLLAVNKGSLEPPTFTIMEHKPAKPKNKKPIVIVGKGVVYDTGGLSLKPTPNSMDKMKSDMSGAAMVAGLMFAIGSLDLPLHIIGLVPATDNRPGQDAYVPGDIIKMYSGKTVEVLNTDAEGRMILADALHLAKKYDPEMVLDFATLTGAAAAAIGDVAMVAMGNLDEEKMKQFKEAGFRQNEKVVEFPMWEEYGDLIKSEIADIKNIGGPKGGAITAGKFLEHFTDYPWVHFDIAGVAYRDGKKHYWTDGGTAFGLRMMMDWLMGK